MVDCCENACKRGQAYNIQNHPHPAGEILRDLPKPFGGKAIQEIPKRNPQRDHRHREQILGQRSHVFLKQVQPDCEAQIFREIVDRYHDWIKDQDGGKSDS